MNKNITHLTDFLPPLKKFFTSVPFSRLTLYVAKTVLTTTFIVAVAFMSIFIIITFLTQAGDIGRGNYSIFSALLYVLYQIPSNLYVILPVSSMIGCLMGLGVLANNSELIVMRSAGLSIYQISKGVILAGAVMACVAFFLGAYLGPITAKQSAFNRTVATDGSSTLVADSTESLWLKDKNSFIHVHKSTLTGNLSGIVRYSFKNGELTQVTTANQAHYKDKSWHLDRVTSIDLNKTNAQKESSHSAIWSSLVPPRLLKVIGVNTGYLTINALIEYIHYTQSNNQSVPATELSLWQMIFQPISVLILMMVAVPFVFGPMRSSAMGFKFIIGLSIGFVFFIVNQFFGPLTLVYGLPPFIGAALPCFIFACLLALMFWKMRE